METEACSALRVHVNPEEHCQTAADQAGSSTTKGTRQPNAAMEKQLSSTLNYQEMSTDKTQLKSSGGMWIASIGISGDDVHSLLQEATTAIAG